MNTTATEARNQETEWEIFKVHPGYEILVECPYQTGIDLLKSPFELLPAQGNMGI